MKIRCKVCGDYFFPDEETLALMSDGYLLSTDVNTCDECWDMLNNSFNNDTEEMITWIVNYAGFTRVDANLPGYLTNNSKDLMNRYPKFPEICLN